MEDKLNLEISTIDMFLGKDEIYKMQPVVNSAHNLLKNKNGKGSEFLGWLDLPLKNNLNELEKIKAASEKIRNSCDVFVVIGVGGSYLGARSAIEMLSHNFYNLVPDRTNNNPVILFAGNNISSVYLRELVEVVKDKDICINVISKSGTTTEPAIAFRVLKELLQNKYGKEGARERIFATTDKSKGALKAIADEDGYDTFVIPDDIGGRYSVLTPVGLLPIACRGLDIDSILAGARAAALDMQSPELDKNNAYKYAAIRNILYNKGKSIELLANFEPSMHYFGEWFKQLFGESEGKDGKGIFPAAVDFSTDLHSMGQYIQDGRRIIFETFINIEKAKKDIILNADSKDLDGLNLIAGRSLDYVRKQAYMGTVAAHREGNVPVISINIPEISEYHYGYMVYFFELACAMSGYLMDVNPFDQPGVEMYKKNMLGLINSACREDKDKM